MNFGICNVSVAPVRFEPSDCSEMVTQLLFGEKVEVLKNKNNWIYIKINFDSYEGWVDIKQITPILEDEFLSIKDQYFTAELFNLIVGKQGPVTLPLGANLPQLSNDRIQFGDREYEVLSEVIELSKTLDRKRLSHTAKQYINVPYLWGGKSNFGIDCSGFVQQVFKIYGIQLPRDAYQQAEIGNMLGFVEEAQVGDLAFFDNEEGKIIHVGIILDDKKIIHAHGSVRIDPLDSTGIFNTDSQKYSHKLRYIKNIIS